jgi:CRISPR system Cascade subunit CasD
VRALGIRVVMPHRYLVLHLEAPMVAFGDVMIDSLGPIREAPSVSAISGLLANALGINREETERLSRLQDRLVLATRLNHGDSRFTDFQTAQLNGKDRGWTTSGTIQERAGGANTFNSPHIRWRDYDSDVSMTVAIRLRDAVEPPTLDDVSKAVQWPFRPLFLGRKCCLPSSPLFAGFAEADDALHALHQVPLRLEVRSRARFGRDRESGIVVTLPPDEPCPDGFEAVTSTERRDWPAGVHAGVQRRYRGTVPRDAFATSELT